MDSNVLTKEITLAMGKLGVRIFRNNTGVGWQGKVSRPEANKIVLTDPRPLHAGLCVGSSDLIGYVPVTITPEMVGKTVAVFVALEVKTGRDRLSDEQRLFLGSVKNCGGVAAEVRSEAQAIEAISQAILRDKSVTL